MKSIGGYFSLELNRGELYHPNAIALNTGRNCLEYIMRCRGCQKIYIPYYTCEVILEPFQKLGVAYEYYHVDKQLEIAGQIALKDDEALLYTNYFGLKQRYVEQLAKQYGKHLIVDNTQAFYAKPVDGIDSFYTCRKFFGVPDGAYLYSDAKADFKIEQDVSYDWMTFLLKRLDLGAESGYADFHELSKHLVGQPIMWMSNLTMQMMQGIDYQTVAQKRYDNYQFLHESLATTNQLQLPLDSDAVPMVYPYLTDDKNLKQLLISEKVFVSTYWPNVMAWCKPVDWEHGLAERTVFIPIDQRYGKEEMKRITEMIGRKR